ncbi:MAG: hypothetical protein AB1529_05070 [Candidatus Micrarchaeota archaeon]
MRFERRLMRVELCHRAFADARTVRNLKDELLGAMGDFKATRAVLRVLTEGPRGDAHFRLEANVRTHAGELAVFGCNAPERTPPEMELHRETTYLAKTLCQQRRPLRQGLGIIRLDSDRSAAEEVSALLCKTYSSHPMGLDPVSVLGYMERFICYGVLERGAIVSALFGQPHDFGPLRAVEFTLSATSKAARGTGLTTALAARIKSEAESRYERPLMIAETIAAPVMRSCHDLGMQCSGVLRSHYSIGIGERLFTNLYLWSL